MTESSVRVAVRIRPQSANELASGCNVSVYVTPGEPHVTVGIKRDSKSFTFDDVFPIETTQEEVFNTLVRPLVDGALEGYNAAIMAYGQTGAGKTYCMGSAFDLTIPAHAIGMIPRSVSYLFQEIERKRSRAVEDGLPPPEFKISAQFLELYNEDVNDLFEPRDKTLKSNIRIHENAEGDIYVTGVSTRPVASEQDCANCIQMGTLSRATAATNMNSTSSRSHAIFTLIIKQKRVSRKDADEEDDELEFETLSAKFNFVDLAGSERLKRTGATGDRAKEGIAINCGLLALGNVISCLGDASKRGSHVPYRDSKLTRLLQDSLGGNSRTLIIACISPSDIDMCETINTLRYANRARNIKNKVSVNQDKNSKQLAALRAQITALENELMEFKQGRRKPDEDSVGDLVSENKMLLSELDLLRQRIKAQNQTIEEYSNRIAKFTANQEISHITSNDSDNPDPMSSIITKYVEETEKLRAKLSDSEHLVIQLRQQAESKSKYPSASHPIDSGISTLVEEARLELERTRSQASETTNARCSTKLPLDGDSDEEGSELSTQDEADSSTEEDDRANIEKDLVNISDEITIKERLIIELENSVRRMDAIKDEYNSKIILLQNKISEVENARDLALKSGGKSENKSEDANKLKTFKLKINDLEKELKRVKNGLKGHMRLMQENKANEQRLQKITKEMEEMKRNKVKLMRQFTEEQAKHRQREHGNNLKLAKMQKEQRKKDIRIQNLEVDRRQREAQLQRKREEIEALKKSQKTMSARVAGRVIRDANTSESPVNDSCASMLSNTKQRLYSVRNTPPVTRKQHRDSKGAADKWLLIEKGIKASVYSKQTLAVMEKELLDLSKEREVFVKRRNDLNLQTGEVKTPKQQEELNVMTCNIDFINEKIGEVQSSILTMEDTNENFDSMLHLLKNASFNECRCLLKNFLHAIVDFGLESAINQNRVKELEAQLHQSELNSSVHQQLLDYVIMENDNEELNTTFIKSSSKSAPQEIDDLNSTIVLSDHEEYDLPKISDPIFANSNDKKAIDKTFSTEEMLFGSTRISLEKTDSPRAQIENTDPNTATNGSAETAVLSAAPVRVRSRTPNPPSNRQLSIPRQLSASNKAPLKESNVFQRLTKDTNRFSLKKGSGTISVYKGQLTDKFPFTCAFVAEGHRKAVTCADATDRYLFTGSQDRTARVWDLERGQEIATIEDHPNNVNSIRYNESGVLLTASLHRVKIWDLRISDAQCVQTLTSSGASSDDNCKSLTTMPSTENQVMKIECLGDEKILTAAGNGVRVWDFRNYQSYGRFCGGFQAVVVALALTTFEDKDMVIAGSRDHSIKGFDLTSLQENCSSSARLNFDAQHYDGVQCLAFGSDPCIFYSGSRDRSIRKWDLGTQGLTKTVTGAHKDWVCDLTVLPSSNFVSCCRSGFIKVWDQDCMPISTYKAHNSSVNAMVTNGNFLFTASSDWDVKMWKLL